MKTIRLTMAQALIHWLAAQQVERDGVTQRFIASVWGIFGHGNVAGIGQALQQYAAEMPYYLARNEQAQVLAAAAFAKQKCRLQTFACTSSIGPGATNMLTGAAVATVNRLPVLLLPGDIFANRIPAPVLQQLESEQSQDISVNDCFKPVSRYWDRINRPDQLLSALPEALRVLTSPDETGAVTLALPQDVQTEAFSYPASFFEPRVWAIPRPRADLGVLKAAAELLRASQAPLIIAGGGAHYSDALDVLRRFAEAHGVPVTETQAGKGALPYDHPLNLGALGVTGTLGANRFARDADCILAVGTRLSDFTTASHSAFQHPGRRFVHLNISGFDAHKLGALPVIGDARASLEELHALLGSWQTDEIYRTRANAAQAAWDEQVAQITAPGSSAPLTQAEVIGALNGFLRPQDVIVCAAGSLPGDLHKLWRSRDPRGYHLEYGYSTMGYEIAGGMGVKLADPQREVYVLVGDGSYLMMSSEIATMVQERLKMVIVVLDNGGFASIGGLSASVGSAGFGTRYRQRSADGALDGPPLTVDFAANAASLGAHVLHAADYPGLLAALHAAQSIEGGPVCIVCPVEREARVPGFESWWDVPVAEVSDDPAVQAARQSYEEARHRRDALRGGGS